MDGKLISIEGTDGAGKTTIVNELKSVYESFGIMFLREPGSTPVGERIRDILKSKSLEMPDRTELMLFEAARACIVDQVILPALKNGQSVVLDRFYDSTTAYQGYGRGIDLTQVYFLNGLATNGLTPDLTVLLDIDPEIGMARRGAPSDRIESAGLELQKRIRNGFLEMAKDNPRFFVVNSRNSVGNIVFSIQTELQNRFGWRVI